ncbi:MAG: polysaccharide deacetylase family protein, partial [Bacteroidota bacterium]
HYHFVTMEMLIDAIQNNTSLPPKSVLLTFDDAYIDHFLYVFPILDKYKIQGSFFPPAKAIKEHIVLDVNKIHFILAAEEDRSVIISAIKRELNKYREQYNLSSYEFYYKKLAKPGRYDTAEVIFIKRLLQVELEEDLRKMVVNNLFQEIVGIDEESFSKELYMNMSQMRCMLRNGMHIGSHTYDHYWLNSLVEEKQRTEISKSYDFLEELGVDMNNWTMCYPYGAYDHSTINILKEFDCKLALSTRVDVADLSLESRFELPRLNTNDIPKDSTSEVNKWFTKG